MSKYFDLFVSNLNLKVPKNLLSWKYRQSYSCSSKYQNHPSIEIIHIKHRNERFSFSNISLNCIQSEIKDLDPHKATRESDIPTKTIKENLDIFSKTLQKHGNNIINASDSPSTLKLADVTTAYKKVTKWQNKLLLINILSNLSNIFQKILNRQMPAFFEWIFSKCQTGFWKNLSAQNCLILITEKFRQCLDQKGEYVALLTHLSKASNCLPQDLIIAKLNAYGFDLCSTLEVCPLLLNRKVFYSPFMCL